MNEKDKQVQQSGCECVAEPEHNITVKIDDTAVNIARALFGLKPLPKDATPAKDTQEPHSQ